MKCSSGSSNPTVSSLHLLILFSQYSLSIAQIEQFQQSPPLRRQIVANGIIVLPLIQNTEVATVIPSTIAFTVALPVVLPVSKNSEGSSLDLCYSRLDNFALRNAVAYEVFEGFEALQCAERCVRAQKSLGFELNCRSFVFEPDPNVCLFYETSAKNFTVELVWKPNAHYHQLRSDCSFLSSSQSQFSSKQQQQQKPQVQQTNLQQSQPVQSCELCDNEGTIAQLTTSPQTIPSLTTTMPFLRISDCPMGLVATMERVTGKQIPNPTAPTIENISEQDCVALCTRNRLQDGFPILCRSLNYIANGGKCSLSTSTSAPGRQNTLVDNSFAVYYEKLCLPKSASSKCSGSYVERFPQKMLVGFNQKLERVATYDKCVEICLDSQVLYGFVCRSGMFYSDSSGNTTNCVMNFETYKAEPDLFVTELTNPVEYFDVTKCDIPDRSRDIRPKG